jgi:hypothetical protein
LGYISWAFPKRETKTKARREVRILCCITKPLELMVQDTILGKSFGNFLLGTKRGGILLTNLLDYVWTMSI